MHRAVLVSGMVFAQAITLAHSARAEGSGPFSFSGTLGGIYAPTYEGSDTSEGGALIDFNVSIRDGLFFAGTRGIGFAPINTETMSVKLAIGYGGERKMEDDPTNLSGLGDIDGEALAIVSGEYRIGQISFGAELKGGQDYGATVDFKVSTGVECTDRITLGGEISATYADDSHMQRYFGVTAAQSAASGKAVYGAGSGIKSAGVGVSVSFAVTQATSIDFGARYDRLMGDAGNSPITQDKGQTSAFLGVSTQF
ncbi:MipA/OmpV family protein [Tabrizicola sp.]|uniref:MipA/OmpV family protein n=1 Tax=Tabrizicola sp. TaxID=2005166 RepID=UPI00286C9D63|nr:MipA/OmpV family protein [Tabrizicola sp.]